MNTPPAVVNEAFMRERGLQVIGHRVMQSMQENMANFKCAYGASPACLAAIWNDMLQSNDNNIRLDANARVDHLFWTFHFLKAYPKGRNMSAGLKASQKTIMMHIKQYIGRLAILMQTKVRSCSLLFFTFSCLC